MIKIETDRPPPHNKKLIFFVAKQAITIIHPQIPAKQHNYLANPNRESIF